MRVTIYLPDELAAEVKASELNVSAVCQEALREALVSREETSKVHENRIRRMADRQGLVLKKSRRRDSRATDYGYYQLHQRDGELLLEAKGLHVIERWLLVGGNPPKLP
jgi:post-segregation antitoxin (ccd killing protein)